MDRNIPSLISIACITLLLSSCTWFTSPDTRHKGTCRTLNSRLIFSGATSDPRAADIQRAERPLQQRNFDRDNCD